MQQEPTEELIGMPFNLELLLDMVKSLDLASFHSYSYWFIHETSVKTASRLEVHGWEK